ncbi:MAG: Ig-like domain-containing protein [Myxococcales bacterium]|nr:Ig-like domain-containing protein [Myxococcales bacterium]
MRTREPLLALLATLALTACGGETSTPDAGGVDASVACTNDDGCPTDQHCDDASQVCVAGNGNECEADAECGDGRVCNTAVTDCGATRCRNACEPASCTAHADCGTWVCIGGTCAEPPSCATEACPGDLVCSANMVCVAPATCGDDPDCPQGQICAGGVCRVPFSCTANSSCPTGLVCQQGVCDDPCAVDADCGDATMFGCDATTGNCRQRCLGDDTQCPSGEICESFACIPAECSQDLDCPGNMVECQGEEAGHGRCVDVVACTTDAECEPNFTCENMVCVELPACRVDRECGGGAYCQDRHCQPAEPCVNGACITGFSCINDLCVPGLCRGDADCPNAGEVCVAGECLAPVPATAVTEVRILTPAGTVPFGGTYRFTAVALNANGDVVPGVTIAWTTGDAQIASIDAAGLATALSAAGTTDVVAAVDTGSQTISSAPVRLTVVDAVPQGNFRVTVVSAATGLAVGGATVVCNQQTQTTDAAGVATFDATVPKTCTAYTADHDYLTVVGLTGADARLALPALTRTDRSTGYTGMVDLSQVTSAVRLSFSGGSFPSPLAGFAPANILGGDVFLFDLPVVGTVAFPSGATARAEVGGFPLDLKSTYYAQTRAGLRRAWSFGGGAELTDLGIGNGSLLLNILPLLQTFVHGGSTGLESLVPLPTVVDAQDIDGDGDTAELVPDYNAFVPKNTTPRTAQTLRYVIDGTTASLPADTNAVMVVSGVLLPQIGFVPLGLDGIGEPLGAVGRFTTAMAPPYAGLEAGTYAVLVAAVNIVPDTLPQVSSTRMVVADTLPAEISLGAGWMGLPSGSFDDGTQALTVQTSTGADVWRARFAGTSGGWEVYAAAGTTSVVLPTAPATFEQRTAGSTVQIDAIDLTTGVDLDALFQPGADALFMDRSTAGFAQQRLR